MVDNNGKPSIVAPLSPEELEGCDMELGVAEGKFVMRFNRPMRTIVLSKAEAHQLVSTLNLYLQTR